MRVDRTVIQLARILGGVLTKLQRYGLSDVQVSRIRTLRCTRLYK